MYLRPFRAFWLKFKKRGNEKKFIVSSSYLILRFCAFKKDSYKEEKMKEIHFSGDYNLYGVHR